MEMPVGAPMNGACAMGWALGDLPSGDHLGMSIKRMAPQSDSHRGMGWAPQADSHRGMSRSPSRDLSPARTVRHKDVAVQTAQVAQRVVVREPASTQPTADFAQQAGPGLVAVAQAVVQTEPAARREVAAQACPAPLREAAVQAECPLESLEADLLAVLSRRPSTKDRRTCSTQTSASPAEAAGLERPGPLRLRTENARLGRAIKEMEARAVAVGAQAARDLRLTVVRPRLSLSIGADQVEAEAAAWEPGRLKAELEAEVLPHFQKVLLAQRAGQAEPPEVGHAMDLLMRRLGEDVQARVAQMLPLSVAIASQAWNFATLTRARPAPAEAA